VKGATGRITEIAVVAAAYAALTDPISRRRRTDRCSSVFARSSNRLSSGSPSSFPPSCWAIFSGTSSAHSQDPGSSPGCRLPTSSARGHAGGSAGFKCVPWGGGVPVITAPRGATMLHVILAASFRALVFPILASEVILLVVGVPVIAAGTRGAQGAPSGTRRTAGSARSIQHTIQPRTGDRSPGHASRSEISPPSAYACSPCNPSSRPTASVTSGTFTA